MPQWMQQRVSMPAAAHVHGLAIRFAASDRPGYDASEGPQQLQVSVVADGDGRGHVVYDAIVSSTPFRYVTAEVPASFLGPHGAHSALASNGAHDQ